MLVVFVSCSLYQSGGDFDRDLVLNQLQQLRVLDTALIQSYGYPRHVHREVFVEQYGELLSKANSVEPSTENCRKILQVARLEDWEIGNTKVSAYIVCQSA